MNALSIAMIASMLALPVAGIIIVAVCIGGDIQSRKELKHFEDVMHKCAEVCGWDFTSRMLERCSRDNLPVRNRIELLEHFAGIKDIRVAIAERRSRA